jgi:hypothetical protein
VPLVRGYARFHLCRHCCECRQFVWTACSRTRKRDDLRSNWEGSGALYHAYFGVKGFLRPISGSPNRLFAGCLQVRFRFGENCNVLFKPENNPQTLPDSYLPNAAISAYFILCVLSQGLFCCEKLLRSSAAYSSL